MSARTSRLVSGVAALLAVCGAVRDADAYPFGRRLSLRGELSLGVVVGEPQTLYYSAGAIARAFVGLTLIEPLSIQVSAMQGVFPSRILPASLNTDFMVGLRAEPRTVRPDGRIFVDVNAGLAITGYDRRLGVDVGIGWEFAVTRYFLVGPVIRYAHIFQPDAQLPGVDTSDAHYVTFGVSFDIRPFPAAPQRRGRLVVIGPGGEPDSDYDGIPDSVDQCPDVVEDHDGFEDEDGCPDLDDDGDGIPDSEDRCPRAPETVNGFEDEDGCPDTLPGTQEHIVWDGTELRLRQRVYFAVGRFTVPSLFSPILTELGSFLVAHPEIRRLRVEGHADDRGTRREGFSLSLRRAQAVIAFLVERGVDASRLVPVGFGDLAPLDTAHDEVTRARNRRIEFIIDDGPGGRAPALPEAAWTLENRPAALGVRIAPPEPPPAVLGAPPAPAAPSTDTPP